VTLEGVDSESSNPPFCRKAPLIRQEFTSARTKIALVMLIANRQVECSCTTFNGTRDTLMDDDVPKGA
jgi:hypothetical protein